MKSLLLLEIDLAEYLTSPKGICIVAGVIFAIAGIVLIIKKNANKNNVYFDQDMNDTNNQYNNQNNNNDNKY